ncbi:AbrB family transcriptional regulator [Bifidobacteriaceae bacterium NR002]|nr:AbrB family transcriptional regulator [Bifidobacteriaceae bacterium NR002]MDZ7549269.1 AbrB family transcriptional regulator [Bifidobacteriaceae bacterium NR047]
MSNDNEKTQGNNDSSYEPLTAVYEHLRHSEDSDELHEFARRKLPDRADQAAFSRATSLLEAVAGNAHTPEEDRIYLATSMPFPNILVKLSEDSSNNVRLAVAKNTDAKNWLVGRLTKDSCGAVRDAALCNPKASWKMRLEGAQCDGVGAETLQYLASLGVSAEENAPVVLATMVRRAVALNPGVPENILQKLCDDKSEDVAMVARSRCSRE